MPTITEIPSIHATHADPNTTSDRFSFVSTKKIMDVLETAGWKAVRAYGSTSDPFGRHRIHFRRNSDEGRRLQFGGDAVPEAVLFNGHNGTTRYRLHGGIFRMICRNGMIVAEESYGNVEAKHLGVTEQDILERSQEIVNSFSNLADVVNEWKVKEVVNPLDFAVEASKLRWDEDMDSSDRNRLAENLLNVRRTEDQGNDLWHTFNRVQENLTQGGFTNHLSNRIVKPVTEIYRNTRINESLWNLGVQEYSNN